MKNLLSLSIILVALTFASCSKRTLRGEGSTITDTRSLSSITSVTANGDVDLEVYPSTTNKVEITGYENLVPEFESSVSSGRLTLEYRNKFRNIKNNNIHVRLYVNSLAKILLNGSGNVKVKAHLDTEELQTEINGSGNMSFETNEFNTFRTKINGSGNMRARDVIAANVYAEISGSGEIEVTATNYLRAHISGSGTIDYWGSPAEVDTEISGSGKIRKN